MFNTLYITIDPFNKKTEIFPFDIHDSDLCWLKEWFDKVADVFEDSFQVKVENDVLNKRVIATLVGTGETCTVDYSMVGFKVRCFFDVVRFLAEELGLFQWDCIVREGRVIYRREK